MPREVTYTTTLSDYFSLSRRALGGAPVRPTYRFAGVVIGCFFIAIGVLDLLDTTHWDSIVEGAILTSFGLFLALLLSGALFKLPLLPRILTPALKPFLPTVEQLHRIDITETGLVDRTPHQELLHYWSRFADVADEPGGVTFYAPADLPILRVPSRAFANSWERQRFYDEAMAVWKGCPGDIPPPPPEPVAGEVAVDYDFGEPEHNTLTRTLLGQGSGRNSARWCAIALMLLIIFSLGKTTHDPAFPFIVLGSVLVSSVASRFSSRHDSVTQMLKRMDGPARDRFRGRFFEPSYGRYRLIVSETGLAVFSPSSRRAMDWSTVTSVGETDEIVLLRRGRAMNVAVPAAAFDSPQRRQEFVRFVRQHIPSTIAAS